MKRSAGILMPVSSLPSKYGIGCFDETAYRFIDWLKEAGQTYWQILPLVPTSYGDSPYQSFSTFAGNPYFISLDWLTGEGLLTAEETAAVILAARMMILTMQSCMRDAIRCSARLMSVAISTIMAIFIVLSMRIPGGWKTMPCSWH